MATPRTSTSNPSPVTTGPVLGRYVVDGLTFTDTRQPPRDIGPHWHDQAGISIPLRGTYRECHGSVAHACGPGSVVVKPAGASHTNRYDAETRSVIIEISSEALERFDLEPVFTEPCVTSEMRLFSTSRRISRELAFPDSATPLALCSLALDALGSLLRSWPPARDRPNRSFFRAVEVIHERWRDSLSLDEIAGLADTTPGRLVGDFRRYLDTTVGDYLRDVRVEHACVALRDTDAPIARIAYETGFCDQSHLTRVFRSKIGTTPARYRAEA